MILTEYQERRNGRRRRIDGEWKRLVQRDGRGEGQKSGEEDKKEEKGRTDSSFHQRGHEEEWVVNKRTGSVDRRMLNCPCGHYILPCRLCQSKSVCV